MESNAPVSTSNGDQSRLHEDELIHHDEQNLIAEDDEEEEVIEKTCL